MIMRRRVKEHPLTASLVVVPALVFWPLYIAQHL
jgi:hypothetical protein